MEHQRLIINWRSEKTREIIPVAELIVRDDKGAERFEFGYLEGARHAASLGFQAFPAFENMARRYASSMLFPFFRNRIIPSTRPDYVEFVTELGLAGPRADAVEVLGRSGGRRQTDRIETVLAPQYDPSTNQYLTRFLVRGVRYVSDAEKVLQTVNTGDRLSTEIDHTNPVNPQARRLLARGQPIGYVPDYLLSDIDALERAGTTLNFEVERVNPPPKPVHYRVLVRLTADWPEGFKPLHTSIFNRYVEAIVPRTG